MILKNSPARNQKNSKNTVASSKTSKTKASQASAPSTPVAFLTTLAFSLHSFFKNFNSRKIIIPLLSILFGLSLGLGTRVWAEQQAGTPDSGSSSRIKQTYDELNALSYGSEVAGDWGDWGSWWNRIRSAAEWVPDGNSAGGDAAVALDVRDGKTFYADGTRTQLTGSAEFIDYSLQSLQVYDDYQSSASSEEGSWTQISSDPEIWQDDRTGLYWSESQDNMANEFDIDNCSFFTTNPRGNYEVNPEVSEDCGLAIETCANLTDGDYTNWYLPTQKELQQAYINGIYNQTDGSFVDTSHFWSSTELSDNDGRAWRVYLHSGYTNFYAKDTTTLAVRCVRRD